MKKYITPVRVFVVFSIGVIVAFIDALGGFDEDYSLTDLKENFKDKEAEIYELKNYFNSITPENKYIEIDFDGSRILEGFEIRTRDTAMGEMSESKFLVWNLKINTQRLDSFIALLGWTKETLKTLKEKLDDANCIGIENGIEVVRGKHTKIEFQRSGPGMYSFLVFDKPIPDNLKKYYNDSCRYILVNDSLALEFSSGVLGAQCFYDLK